MICFSVDSEVCLGKRALGMNLNALDRALRSGLTGPSWSGFVRVTPGCKATWKMSRSPQMPCIVCAVSQLERNRGYFLAATQTAALLSLTRGYNIQPTPKLCSRARIS